MDIKKLISVTDAVTVAEYLGMEIVEKGKYKYIRCPGHEARVGHPDANIGNAVLSHKGYRCFACGVFVNTHDMVMEYTGCSPTEAYGIMAEAMGLDPDADLKEENDPSEPRLWLSAYEAKTIGIYPKFREVVGEEPRKDGVSVIQDGLFVLYNENPEQYYRIIVERAKQAKAKYLQCRKHFASVNADKAYAVYDLLGDHFDGSVYGKIKWELDERIETCSKIIKIFKIFSMQQGSA